MYTYILYVYVYTNVYISIYSFYKHSPGLRSGRVRSRNPPSCLRSFSALLALAKSLGGAQTPRMIARPVPTRSPRGPSHIFTGSQELLKRLGSYHQVSTWGPLGTPMGSPRGSLGSPKNPRDHPGTSRDPTGTPKDPQGPTQGPPGPHGCVYSVYMLILPTKVTFL